MKSHRILLALPLLVGAVPAVAAPEPAVDDYKCIFAGQCEDVDKPVEEPTQKAPETKGFKLSVRTEKPAAVAAAPAPVSAVRPRPAATAVGRGKPVRAVAPAAAGRFQLANPAATPGVSRANLRLSFTSGSAQLDAVGQRNAKVFAEALKTDALKDKRFLIEGHTDAAGGRAVNALLSQRRAQAVADFLASEGVPASRLEVKGFGFDRPLPGTRAGNPANRRVEAVLIK